MASFGDVLKKIVPTIATVFGGPLAGLAVDEVGKAFNIDLPTKEKIENILRGPLSGDQIVQLKVAEQSLVVKLEELHIRLEELDVQDRMSAREREIKLGGRTTTVLGYIVVGALVGMAFMVVFTDREIESALAGSIIGYLVGLAQQVFNYHFGSSRGSADKSVVMENMQAQVVSLAKTVADQPQRLLGDGGTK